MAKTHIMSDETGRALVSAVLGLGARTALTFDESTGRYDNDSIKRWLEAGSEGMAYGVSVPKGEATGCTKTGANAGIANPVPGVIGRPAVDPYVGRGAFRLYEVNGGVDPDGTPYVTAFRGDGNFTRTGADVWILTPTLWWSHSESDGAVEMSVSDTRLSGMQAQPQGELPSGDRRPYMLYAKYWLGEGEGYSRSGQQADVFDVSHNSLITKCANATTGYSGLSFADYWYQRVMLLLKYATKNAQSVFAGATSWNSQVHPTVAETGATRVIVSNADAAKFVVGGTVSLGSALNGTTAVTDRQDAKTRDRADRVSILSIGRYDDENQAITLDAPKAFDTATTDLLSTMVWNTGSCDQVEGDGSPHSCTSGREPFVLQGIEMMGGFYEIVSDVIFHSVGEGWGVYVNPDSRDEKTAYDASVYVDTGLKLPSGDGVYPLYPGVSPQGVLAPQGLGGSTSSGLCDTKYGNPDTATGDREFLSCGSLGGGADAGPWYVSAWHGLGTVWWYLGSRASTTGRGVRAA